MQLESLNREHSLYSGTNHLNLYWSQSVLYSETPLYTRTLRSTESNEHIIEVAFQGSSGVVLELLLLVIQWNLVIRTSLNRNLANPNGEDLVKFFFFFFEFF